MNKERITYYRKSSSNKMVKIEKIMYKQYFFHYSVEGVDFIFFLKRKITPYKKNKCYNLLARDEDKYYLIGNITYNKIRLTLKMNENKFLVMGKFNKKHLKEFSSIFFDKETIQKVSDKLEILKTKNDIKN